MFETTTDRERESLILKSFCAAHRFDKFLRREPFAPFDAFFVRGNIVVAIAEIKARMNPMNQYESVYLELTKFLTLKCASDMLKLPSFFVVGFSDKFAFMNVADVDPDGLSIAFAGNKSRNNVGLNDVTAIIKYPIAKLQIFANNGFSDKWKMKG